MVPEDDTLVEVVDKAGGNLGLVLPFEKARPLDIADIQERRLFEVVSPGQAQREAVKNWANWVGPALISARLGMAHGRTDLGRRG